MWIQGIELRSSGLEADTVSTEPSLWPKLFMSMRNWQFLTTLDGLSKAFPTKKSLSGPKMLHT